MVTSATDMKQFKTKTKASQNSKMIFRSLIVATSNNQRSLKRLSVINKNNLAKSRDVGSRVRTAMHRNRMSSTDSKKSETN